VSGAPGPGTHSGPPRQRVAGGGGGHPSAADAGGARGPGYLSVASVGGAQGVCSVVESGGCQSGRRDCGRLVVVIVPWLSVIAIFVCGL
jgi:hypothetical protein